MDDLKLIKKYYGEKMSHLCRDLFPTVLETPGLLFKTLSDNFYYSKFLYDDIIENNLFNGFKEYIYKLINPSKEEEVCTNKNPYELLEEAGYTLYKCETEEDVQSFRKYYANGEKLCTFKGGRLNSCHVFFAVKKNVQEIKREDFKHPQRQDEYGTSVISIQISKNSGNYLSIKNRYNHTVTNPDATFSNNLDNIIPGLTKAFENHFGYNLDCSKRQGFEIPHYVKTVNGKFYKYNYEIDGWYYCPDNIMIHGGIIFSNYLDKNRYLVFDYFILDLKSKTIKCFYSDSFAETVNKMNVESINIVKNKEGNKEITIISGLGVLIIVIDKQNRMISYYDGINTIIPQTYFDSIKYLKIINLPFVKKFKIVLC